MTDSPLPVRRERPNGDTVAQKLFASTDRSSAPSMTADSAEDGRAEAASASIKTSPIRPQRAVTGALQSGAPRDASAPQDTSSSSSLVNTTRSREAASAAAAINNTADALSSSPSSALSPHLRTASEMELAQFGSGQSGGSGTRYKPRATIGTRPALNPRAIHSGSASSPLTRAEGDSATRRVLAQKYLHHRGASTSQSLLASRAETPVSPSLVSRASSLSIAGRSPRRSVYLDASDEISEEDQERLTRLQRVDRTVCADREHRGRNRIRRDEADAIMAIMSSFQTILDVYVREPRSATPSRSSTPALASRRLSPQLRRSPRPGGEGNAEEDAASDGPSTVVGSGGERGTDAHTGASPFKYGKDSPESVRTPTRPTVTYHGDTDTNNNEEEKEDALSEVKRVVSMPSMTGGEGDSQTRGSRHGSIPSNPRSPASAVRRASSVEVERAQALINEAREMLSGGNLFGDGGDVHRRGSGEASKVIDDDEEEEEDEHDESESRHGQHDEQDGAVPPFASTLMPTMPALDSTMKPAPRGDVGNLLSPRSASQLNSPRSIVGTHGPRTPRTARPHESRSSTALSGVVAQQDTQSLTPRTIISQPARGYDPSIQFVVVTYPSTYWLGQSKLFQLIVWKPVMLVLKLVLLCFGLWILYLLFCFVRNTVVAVM